MFFVVVAHKPAEIHYLTFKLQLSYSSIVESIEAGNCF